MTINNINQSVWQQGTNSRGESWRYLDLSGEHLGVRMEELPPGGQSSDHHFHTSEEEHVLVMQGEATLILGDDEHALKAGDHVCFAPGKELAHHIVNTSQQAFRFLVFGERKSQDVVVYPEQNKIMVKALGWKKFHYQGLTTAKKSPAFKTDDE